MKAIELFNLNIDRAESLLDLHRQAYSRGRPAAGAVWDEVLRAVVVFSISALDAYIHLRIEQQVSEIIYRRHRVPERVLGYIKKSFSEDDLVRELLKIAISGSSQKDIVKCLRGAISGETFQKPGQIERAFNLMEVNNGWRAVRDELRRQRRGPRRQGRPRTAQSVLTELVDRRDDIAHEGDMYTSNVSNRYHGRLKPISRTWVADNLKQLRKIVLAIEEVTKVV